MCAQTRASITGRVGGALKRIFVGDGRLRSGWRLVSYFVASRVLLVVLLIALGLGLAAILRTGFGEFAQGPMGLIVIETVQLIVTLTTVFIWRRRLDRKSFVSLGLSRRGAVRDFLTGILIVAVEWALIFGFALAVNVVEVTAIRFDFEHLVAGIGLYAVLNLLVGLSEEIDARGYILQTLGEGVGFPAAVLVSSLYFGALHLLNPGAGLASTLGVALFGVTASLAYWLTGRLWMGIGMHSAWNVLEGPVFGLPVSGTNMGGLFGLNIGGPEWLTGGTFGPEAGLLTVVPEIILVGVMLGWGWKYRPVPVTAS